MNDLLKSRRRTSGMACLLIVFGLTSFWVRSFDHAATPIPRQVVFDRERWGVGLSFARIDHPVDRFYSHDGCLVWETLQSNIPLIVEDIVSVWMNAFRTHSPDIRDSSESWTWHWRWYGFTNGQFRFSGPYEFQLARWTIPYWSIVIPLTLLSVYLLLSKSKQPNSSTASQP